MREQLCLVAAQRDFQVFNCLLVLVFFVLSILHSAMAHIQDQNPKARIPMKKSELTLLAVESTKACDIARSGIAWMRQHNGDFE